MTIHNTKTSMPDRIIFQKTDYHKSTHFQKLFQTGSNIVIAVLTIIVLLSFGQTINAQGVEHTKASPDQVLRSNARINPSTLAMEFSIPIASLPGRSGASMPLVFNYSSKVWRVRAGGSVNSDGIRWTFADPIYADGSVSGWTSTYGVPTMAYALDESEFYDCQANPVGTSGDWGSPECGTQLYYVKRVRVRLPDGSTHELRKDDGVYPYDSTAPSVDRSGAFLAVDGSRMRLEMANNDSTLYLPDGGRYHFADNYKAEKFTDKNGNVLTFNATTNGWTDTLGKTLSNPFPAILPYAYSHPEGTQSINIPNIGTGTRQYQLVWKKLSNGALAAGEPTEYYDSDVCNPVGRAKVLFVSVAPVRLCSNNGMNYFDPVVLTEVILPNNAKYKFEYNKFGEIVRIDYPTGGYEKFVYDKIAPLSSTQKLAYDQANRGVVSRIVGSGDGGSEYTWTYQAGYTGTVGDGSPYYVTTSAPDGTKTKQFLHRNQAERKNYGFDNPLTGREMETQEIDSLGNIRARKLTEWETTQGISPGFAAYPKRDIRVKRVFSIMTDPATNTSLIGMTESEYDTSGSSDEAQFAALNLKRNKTYHYKVLTAAIGTGDVTAAFGIFVGATPAVISETDYLYDANYRNRGIVGLATETRIKNGSETVKAKSQTVYDESAYLETASISNAPGWENPYTNYRGLPTTRRIWYNIASNQYIETHASFDQFGNPRKNWDGRGNFTETQYADNYTDNTNRNSYALPTKTISYSGTNGTGTVFSASVKYDFNTGLPRYSIDINGQTSEQQYDDALLRPTKAIAPNGQQTITEYGIPSSGQFPANQRFVKIKTQIDANNWKEGYTWFDGLARTVKTQSVDSNGDVFALTCYDQYGRQSKTSNPFRNVSNPSCSTTSLEWTTMTYDAAGRAWKVTTPDSAVVETNYSLATTGNDFGAVVTVKDQSGKQRRSITNALGQLTRVDEPDDSGNLGTISSPNQPTNYSYDTLNNLTTVSQIGTTSGQCGGSTSSCNQTRTFVYDSLSRLKSANNPESQLTSYQYDANGNLTTKIDGRNIATNYLYDALNRVTQRSYSGESGYATPTVYYVYDNLPNAIGKLTKIYSSISTTEFTNFDILGRVLAHKQMTDGQTYSTNYVYNLAGALVEQTLPSGRVVRNVFDADGDLAEVESKKNSSDFFRNYATNFVYTASGAVSSLRLGNGRFENTIYNSRLQPVQIGLGSSATNQSLLKLNFDYGAADNNGNVKSQTITVPTVGNIPGFTAHQVYSYDSLNRLKQAAETINNNQNWKQTFNYDRFGNRRFDESNGNTTTLLQNCPTAVCNPQVDPLTNKLVGYQFDNAGNTKVDAENRIFIYDGENKQVEVKDQYGNPIGRYFYDGDGKRVKKISLTETTLFIYDAIGQLVAEYSTQLSQTPNTSYMTADHLNSPRIQTSATGQVISRHDYQPFGEEIQRANYGADDNRKKFTGYERDSETNLDYAQARMFQSGFGRFTSPDPYNIIIEVQYEENHQKAKSLFNNYLSEPQQWNRYPYVINNPLKFTDPTGEVIYITGSEKERAAALKKLESMLGDERMRQVTITHKKDGKLGDVIELSFNTDKDKNQLDAIGTGDEGIFSVRMSDIIGSSEIVEYRLAESFEAKDGKHTVAEFGGAATVGKDESLTGNVQIFLHPSKSASLAESRLSSVWGRSKSSDGGALYFTEEIINAHEFGHAHEGIQRGGSVNSSRSNDKSVQMENILRARQSGTVGPRRRIKE